MTQAEAEYIASPVASPCVKVCVLDQCQVCVGCGRTLDEIAMWSRLSAEQQRAVCDAAAERRKRIQPGSPP